MCYLRKAFDADNCERAFTCLDKIKEHFFNFADTYIKMKVKIAAKQLSHTMVAIETFYTSGVILESESLHTAEFVDLIDKLFDSLNSSQLYDSEGKKFRCAVSDSSPHLKFWSELLPKLKKWKIFENVNGLNGKIHSNFKFVEGWQITIRAVMYLWNILREKGLTFLILRNFNQDPLENLFGQIRQHGFANNNPTCYQFIAAFKTLIINNLSSPISSKNNCEDDQCESLGDFSIFLQKYSNKKLNKEIFNDDLFNETSNEELDNFSKNNFATAYVAAMF